MKRRFYLITQCNVGLTVVRSTFAKALRDKYVRGD